MNYIFRQYLHSALLCICYSICVGKSQAFAVNNPLYYCVCKTTMHVLYCSIFMPYLTYGPEIWGNTYPTSVESINLLQKRVIRIVYGAKRLAHTSLHFLKLSILKLSDLCKLRTLLFMHKAYYNLFPPSIQCLFSKRVTTYTTRLNNQFDKPLCHTSMRSMSRYVYGVKLWNSMDPLMSAITTHSR